MKTVINFFKFVFFKYYNFCLSMVDYATTFFLFVYKGIQIFGKFLLNSVFPCCYSIILYILKKIYNITIYILEIIFKGISIFYRFLVSYVLYNYYIVLKCILKKIYEYIINPIFKFIYINLVKDLKIITYILKTIYSFVIYILKEINKNIIYPSYLIIKLSCLIIQLILQCILKIIYLIIKISFTFIFENLCRVLYVDYLIIKTILEFLYEKIKFILQIIYRYVIKTVLEFIYINSLKDLKIIIYILKKIYNIIIYISEIIFKGISIFYRFLVSYVLYNYYIVLKCILKKIYKYIINPISKFISKNVGVYILLINYLSKKFWEFISPYLIICYVLFKKFFNLGYSIVRELSLIIFNLLVDINSRILIYVFKYIMFFLGWIHTRFILKFIDFSLILLYKIFLIMLIKADEFLYYFLFYYCPYLYKFFFYYIQGASITIYWFYVCYEKIYAIFSFCFSPLYRFIAPNVYIYYLIFRTIFRVLYRALKFIIFKVIIRPIFRFMAAFFSWYVFNLFVVKRIIQIYFYFSKRGFLYIFKRFKLLYWIHLPEHLETFWILLKEYFHEKDLLTGRIWIKLLKDTSTRNNGELSSLLKIKDDIEDPDPIILQPFYTKSLILATIWSGLNHQFLPSIYRFFMSRRLYRTGAKARTRRRIFHLVGFKVLDKFLQRLTTAFITSVYFLGTFPKFEQLRISYYFALYLEAVILWQIFWFKYIFYSVYHYYRALFELAVNYFVWKYIKMSDFSLLFSYDVTLSQWSMRYRATTSYIYWRVLTFCLWNYAYYVLWGLLFLVRVDIIFFINLCYEMFTDHYWQMLVSEEHFHYPRYTNDGAPFTKGWIGMDAYKRNFISIHDYQRKGVFAEPHWYWSPYKAPISWYWHETTAFQYEHSWRWWIRHNTVFPRSFKNFFLDSYRPNMLVPIGGNYLYKFWPYYMHTRTHMAYHLYHGTFDRDVLRLFKDHLTPHLVDVVLLDGFIDHFLNEICSINLFMEDLINEEYDKALIDTQAEECVDELIDDMTGVLVKDNLDEFREYIVLDRKAKSTVRRAKTMTRLLRWYRYYDSVHPRKSFKPLL